MVSKTTHKAKAVILRSIDYGESDRIVTFFTEEFGKVKAIAKGARRSRKRFANALENFSHSRIVFSKRSREGLALLEACDVINHFAGIRTDLDKSLTAAYFSELVDLFTLEGKRNDQLFSHLIDFLSFLDARVLSEGMVRIFELRLLKLQGYEPVLDRCMACKRSLEEISRIFFSAAEGGIRCGTCDRRTGDVWRLSHGTVKTLLLGRTMAMEKLPLLIFSHLVLEESRGVLTSFIQHLLGREVKSLNVLNEIKHMAL